MICLLCGHYTHPDRELDRDQGSENCKCDCHPWNNKTTVESIPDNCLPPSETIQEVLRGPTIGADGKITDGVWAGMTPAEVLAERDAYNRACGE